ncbi:hypothetical protein ACS0TY_027020 [Phlomoides rotata]
MGCFLACVGFKTKKRRRPSKKTPSEEHDNQRYVPLDSDELKVKQKIKKKVRFNLNVKAYEPIPQNYEDDDDLASEVTKWELETETKSIASLHYEEDDIIASSSIFSHRYQNCRDSYDDENDDAVSVEDFPWEFESGYYDDDVLMTSQIREARNTKLNVRDRSEYVCSVLNPVENLSQWKLLKARGATPPPQLKICQKENLI